MGGTFDHLHVGHKRLLEESFLHASRVGIGLTSDALVAAAGKGAGIAPYRERKGDLEIWLRRSYPAGRWFIQELVDPNGAILEPETPGLAISEETLPVALKANAWRKEHGMMPLTLIVVGRLYGQDFLPIASRRIRSKDIDRDGRRLTPVRIRVAESAGPGVAAAVLVAFKKLLPGYSVRPFAAGGGADAAPDCSVEWKAEKGSVSVLITDILGGQLGNKVSTGPGKAPALPGGEDVLQALASHLIAGAFTPRMLSRNDFLPRSVVIEGGSERWPATLEWTRKVYSSSGVFPYQ